MKSSVIKSLYSQYGTVKSLPFPKRKGIADAGNSFETYYYRDDPEKVKLDKWPHYLEIYEEVFSKFRAKKQVKILEIGVHHGGSLCMLKESFPDAYIVGIDIKPECKECENQDQSIFVEIGDQGNTEFLAEVIAKHGEFDIVIDDGSHIASHQQMSFLYLFLNGLANHGVYLVEDIFVNYLKEYGDVKPNFIEMTYELLKEFQSPYSGDFKPSKFRVNNENKFEKLNVSLAYQLIHSISYFDNVITIAKKIKSALPCMEYR